MRTISLPSNRLSGLFASAPSSRIAAIAVRAPFRKRKPHPLHELWQERDAHARKMLERASTGGHAARQAGREALEVSGRAIERAPRVPLALAAGAFTVGLAAMYYLDPQSGRRRRGGVRGRLSHVRRVVTRDVPKSAERTARHARGVARGVRHDAVEMIPHRHQPADDETLVARVRSEVLREAGVRAGEINVDAYEGCVTLRGQLDDEQDIRHVVDATRRAEGVAEVRSYLHLPNELAPNKAAVMQNGHAPLPEE